MDWTVAPVRYPRIVPIRSLLFARRVRIANRGIRIQLTRSTTRPAPATGRICWSSRYHDEHRGHQGRYRQNDELATQHTASFPFACIATLTDDRTNHRAIASRRRQMRSPSPRTPRSTSRLRPSSSERGLGLRGARALCGAAPAPATDPGALSAALRGRNVRFPLRAERWRSSPRSERAALSWSSGQAGPWSPAARYWSNDEFPDPSRSCLTSRDSDGGLAVSSDQFP